MTFNLLILIATVILMPFAAVVFSGAPYLPTRRKQIIEAIELADITEEDFVVDLGSGDGAIQKVLAEKGVKSLGYEINPFLFLISKIRLRRYSSLAEVRLANFWDQNLPKRTTIVFTFLLDRHMERLDSKLKDQSRKLQKPLSLISFAFKIPGKDPIKIKGGMFLYGYQTKG